MRWGVVVLGVSSVLGCSTIVTDDPTLSGRPRTQPPINSTTVSYSPRDFEGRTAAEIDSLIGTPALSRREGRGEFRRYDFERCSFMMVLVPDGRGINRVGTLYAGALSADAENPSLKECLAGGPKR